MRFNCNSNDICHLPNNNIHIGWAFCSLYTLYTRIHTYMFTPNNKSYSNTVGLFDWNLSGGSWVAEVIVKFLVQFYFRFVAMSWGSQFYLWISKLLLLRSVNIGPSSSGLLRVDENGFVCISTNTCHVYLNTWWVCVCCFSATFSFYYFRCCVLFRVQCSAFALYLTHLYCVYRNSTHTTIHTSYTIT